MVFLEIYISSSSYNSSAPKRQKIYMPKVHLPFQLVIHRCTNFHCFSFLLSSFRVASLSAFSIAASMASSLDSRSERFASIAVAVCSPLQEKPVSIAICRYERALYGYTLLIRGMPVEQLVFYSSCTKCCIMSCFDIGKGHHRRSLHVPHVWGGNEFKCHT